MSHFKIEISTFVNYRGHLLLDGKHHFFPLVPLSRFFDGISRLFSRHILFLWSQVISHLLSHALTVNENCT